MSEHWWRGAVIYQIYPRSFHDANGDGMGDLPGITARLDYLKALGVDGVWISPFFKSPMKDFGYDVSDYRDVAPVFGQLSDFDQLVQQAHARDLKVLIDLVISHTSDQHPWFANSRVRGDKADWYVWADAKPDGAPPNNWLSIFGGSAWQWDPRRGQYFFHNFLASQPDLNFHNEEVVAAVLDVARFWLDRGVDGFRLDTANFYTHDALLRDNPAKAERLVTDGVPLTNPYSFQQHIYDKSRPENFNFLKRLRALMDEYPGTFTIGEIGDDDSLKTAASYVRGKEHLHTAYTFNLLGGQLSPELIQRTVSRMEQEIEDGWPCWSFSNHDCVRAVSRWAAPEHDPADFAKMLAALLTSLKGTICVYQGEELGLPEAELRFEELQDPYGITFWPEFKGRDGCRTPLPWSETEPGAGTWLPVPQAHRALCASVQVDKEGSVLSAYKKILAFRRQHAALRLGSIEFVEQAPPLLAFIRSLGAERILAVFNLGVRAARFEAPQDASPLAGHGFSAQQEGEAFLLPAAGALFFKLSS